MCPEPSAEPVRVDAAEHLVCAVGSVADVSLHIAELLGGLFPPPQEHQSGRQRVRNMMSRFIFDG